MKEYYVFFDVFGKKLKAKIKAKSAEEAASIVRKRIEIVKVVEATTKSEDTSIDDLFEEMKKGMEEIFGGNKFKNFFKRKK